MPCARSKDVSVSLIVVDGSPFNSMVDNESRRILQWTEGSAGGGGFFGVDSASVLAPPGGAKDSREPKRAPRILCSGKVNADNLWTMLRREETSWDFSCLPHLSTSLV